MGWGQMCLVERKVYSLGGDIDYEFRNLSARRRFSGTGGSEVALNRLTT